MPKDRKPWFNQQLNNYLLERGKRLTMQDLVQKLKKVDLFDDYDAHII